MTRIVAGSAGGRRLRVPRSGTRPTSERVREAVFSALGSRFDLSGARVLDLYAGSGALGLEALSRGAVHALFVESDRGAVGVLRGNIAELGLPGAQVRVGRVAAALAAPPERRYDLVFSDPPYALDEEAVAADLAALGEWLVGGGYVVLERSARGPATSWPADYALLQERSYGDTRVELARFDGPTPR